MKILATLLLLCALTVLMLSPVVQGVNPTPIHGYQMVADGSSPPPPFPLPPKLRDGSSPPPPFPPPKKPA